MAGIWGGWARVAKAGRTTALFTIGVVCEIGEKSVDGGAIVCHWQQLDFGGHKHSTHHALGAVPVCASVLYLSFQRGGGETQTRLTCPPNAGCLPDLMPGAGLVRSTNAWHRWLGR